MLNFMPEPIPKNPLDEKASNDSLINMDAANLAKDLNCSGESDLDLLERNLTESDPLVAHNCGNSSEVNHKKAF